MRTFDIAHMRQYNSTSILRRLGEDWTGTLQDLAQHADLLPEDRLMVILRSDMLTEKNYRLFAVNAVSSNSGASEIISTGPSAIAVDAALRFANGTCDRAYMANAYIEGAKGVSFDVDRVYSAAVYSAYSPERAATAANLVSAFLVAEAEENGAKDTEIQYQLESMIELAE